MYKLLSSENKNLVLAEYRARRVRVILFLFSLLLTISVVVILPTIINVFFALESAKVELSTLQASGIDKDSSLDERNVTDFKNKLSLVVPGESINIYDLWRQILLAKPEGVSVQGFFYDQAGAIRVRGISQERSSLISFQTNLQNNKSWSSVELPVESLAQERNAEYELIIKLQ